jgi:hypothetical protein
LVTEVADIIIPRTDTPGARDVGVTAFIDKMLKDTYAREDQERFITGLKEFDSRAQSQYGRVFVKLEPTQRGALVKSVHDAALAEDQKKALSADKLQRPFILMMKELTLLGFFTSEQGATQVLQYLPIPGAQRGCVPLAAAGNGRDWAEETSIRF